MRLREIRRYPVKSMLGEALDAVDIDPRGLVGDRLWAVRDPEGKLGSGKNTRRFRRMVGLLDLRSTLAGTPTDTVPLVELPDGRRLAVDDPVAAGVVSSFLHREVTIERETDIMHHDEGPVSVITTAGLQRLGELHGEPVDPRRFRANLLLDTGSAATGFPEDHWVDRELRVGPDVVLQPLWPLTRCVMIDMRQGQLPEDGRLLHTVGTYHDLTFGVLAKVLRSGRVRIGDPVTVGPR